MDTPTTAAANNGTNDMDDADDVGNDEAIEAEYDITLNAERACNQQIVKDRRKEQKEQDQKRNAGSKFLAR
jgi:hypothetical protein